MRVLVVEHSDDDASVLGAEPGIAVERVTSLAEATSILEPYGRFDVVLLDFALPDATGIEALTQLHRIAPYTPIVVVAGSSEGLEALRAGAHDSVERGADVVRVLRYAFERAAAASREREEVLAMLAHKLRTPLTAILGWTHLLRTGKVVEAKQSKAYETIERNAQSQVTLIEDMLIAAGITRKAPSEPPPSRAGNGRELEGLKVLLVEDDPDTRALLTVLLVTMGAGVSVASSAREGMAYLAKVRHDVIVSDIEMTETSGYTFLQTVRELAADAGGRTPAIALTAHAREADRDRAMTAGFDEHLAKPIRPALLVKAVLRITALRPPFLF